MGIQLKEDNTLKTKELGFGNIMIYMVIMIMRNTIC